MEEKLKKVRDRILADPKYALEMSKHILIVRALLHDPVIVKRVRDDVLFFCRFVLGFEPTKYQAKFLTDPHQFVVARWCRQSGKSYSVGAKLLHIALKTPHTHIGIVSPSFKQSKRVIRKMGPFIKRLEDIGGGLIRKALKTLIECGNGSGIEAFANNPDTVRGPTLHVVYCDEWGFVKNDEDMYDAILFTLGTTDGLLIATSTPSVKGSLFWKMCFDQDFDDFGRDHHVTWREAVEPNGPLKHSILEKIKKQLRGDPWRWRREMEAEFTEDTDRYFPLKLIIKCQDTEPLDKDWDYYPFEHTPSGEFYIGVDFGKKRDHSVVAVMDRRQDGKLRLVHLNQFKLETAYASVIGYVKALCDRYRSVRAITVDRTGMGEYIVEDMKRAIDIPIAGMTLSIPTKQDILGNLKKRMQDGEILIPYDRELFAEINVEQFEVMKSGLSRFSHPSGTHDDRLWALAFAVYTAKEEVAESYIQYNLIESCIVSGELESDPERWAPPPGQYLCGLDLGKIDDFSVVSVVAQREGTLELVFQKQFPLKAPYSEIVDMINQLNQKCRFVHLLINSTGVGAAIMEEFPDVRGIEGIHLSTQHKADILGYLKMRMEQKTFKMPRNPDLCEEMAQQRHKLKPWGASQFWPQYGTHDDRLWSLALAVYTAKEEESEGAVRPAW